uniref:Uncharacterized protein n=1 Tax=Spongospora subterranea TaxID=70186 RepID=A0A0H5QFP3_9EUKA|eukprot:CRZ00863.1 hypothetical protein [Spongospora subterranea]
MLCRDSSSAKRIAQEQPNLEENHSRPSTYYFHADCFDKQFLDNLVNERVLMYQPIHVVPVPVLFENGISKAFTPAFNLIAKRCQTVLVDVSSDGHCAALAMALFGSFTAVNVTMGMVHLYDRERQLVISVIKNIYEGTLDEEGLKLMVSHRQEELRCGSRSNWYDSELFQTCSS